MTVEQPAGHPLLLCLSCRNGSDLFCFMYRRCFLTGTVMDFCLGVVMPSVEPSVHLVLAPPYVCHVALPHPMLHVIIGKSIRSASTNINISRSEAKRGEVMDQIDTKTSIVVIN